MPLEEIARLVGHGSTKVTEIVYRKQLRPVLTRGAQVVDMLFAAGGRGGAELVPQLVPHRQSKSPSTRWVRGSDLRCCWWAILGLNQ